MPSQDFGRQGDRQNRVDQAQRVYGTFHFHNPLSSIPAKKEGQSPRAGIETAENKSSVCTPIRDIFGGAEFML